MSADISLHCPPGLLLDPRHGRDGGGAGAGPQPLHPRLRPRDRDAAVRHAQRGLPQRRDRHAQTRGGQLELELEMILCL